MRCVTPPGMRLIALLVLASPLCAAAQQGDPLKSQACSHALAQLEAARAEGAGVNAARQHAAKVCLGQAEPAAPRANRWAQPPISVPAPVIEPPGRGQAAAPTKPAPPPVQIDRPAAIATCDANGCWTTEGRRLPLLGPNLIGPHGPCAATGGFANCQ